MRGRFEQGRAVGQGSGRGGLENVKNAGRAETQSIGRQPIQAQN